MNYFYDDSRIRYNLVSSRGDAAFNWLFVPGGPGFSSAYLSSLTDLLDLPGNVWFIDLPGNGDHDHGFDDYDRWLEIFPPMIDKFANPIVVGHSFGGMFPLLFPQLESKLRGFVILNSSPRLWLEEAGRYAEQHGLPDLSAELTAFAESPASDTFKAALAACMPYYFPAHTLARGRELLADVPVNFHAAGWWQNKAVETAFDARWIPQRVPVLITSGEHDGVVPYRLFAEDERFDRDNVRLACIDGAGHLPWVEKPEVVIELFDAFIARLGPDR